MEPLRRDYIDDFHGLNRETAGSQMLCFHCEEYISRSAHVCPYCKTQVSVTPHQNSQGNLYSAQGETKITRLMHHDQPFSSSSHGLQGFQTEDEGLSHNSQSSPLTYISSLLFLLMGGAFFFLGILFPILAQDGTITISWDESLWLPFLGVGLALIACGYLFLQRIQISFDE